MDHQQIGQAEFGPFESAFAKLTGSSVPGYLALLWLENDEEVREIRCRVAEALERSGDCVKDISLLFADINWRPHLVGCIALLEAESVERKATAACWAAADAGSWVTPQLLATLRLTDPDFMRQAQHRIDCGFIVTAPDHLDPIERHSATGPAGNRDRMSKYASACIAMLEPGQSIESTVAGMALPHQMISMIVEDADNSVSVALNWYARAKRQFEL